ncbi:hypothetical protein RJT34_23329 [Clitoria ternatea]|uniref:Uncharacterized protein n=1 Tax=Clitoria ternatea TaxID=43366 RepID=A0AAN9IEV2_CLITE
MVVLGVPCSVKEFTNVKIDNMWNENSRKGINKGEDNDDIDDAVGIQFRDSHVEALDMDLFNNINTLAEARNDVPLDVGSWNVPVVKNVDVGSRVMNVDEKRCE